MKTRIIVTIIALPLVFSTLFYFPPYILTGVLSVICALMAYELLLAIIPPKGNIRLFIYTIVTSSLIPTGAYFNINTLVFPIALLTLMSLVFIEAIVRFNTDRQYPIVVVLASFFGGLMIPYLLSTVINLRMMELGRYLVLLPIICAFVTDGSAYFTGVFFGKRKAFPRVSPNKTVEGCIGGIVVGTLSLVIYGIILIHLTSIEFVNFWVLPVYGLLGAIICELGDLAFSLIKREFNLKDYGSLLPGHGGALDRLDSMVFTAPAMYILVTLLPLF